jgi:hypothetical protein
VNKNMMMLTVPMLFAFLITAAFGLRESARAQGNSTLAKRRNRLSPATALRRFERFRHVTFPAFQNLW